MYYYYYYTKKARKVYQCMMIFSKVIVYCFCIELLLRRGVLGDGRGGRGWVSRE